MKKTIQKRADQLEPGDVVVMPAPILQTSQGDARPCVSYASDMRERLVVMRDGQLGTGFSGVRLVVAVLDGIGQIEQMVSIRTFNPEQLLDVEGPDLTPAQVHADRLAEYAADLLRHIEAGHGGNLGEGDYRELRDLVAELKPPEPVTLSEALATLDALNEAARQVQAGEMDVQSVQVERSRAGAMLERARRAGQVPK